MVEKNLLNGKKILAVDDEQDILETLEELLPMCSITKARTFEEAKTHLKNEDFDIAILDIMGVDGYKLLEITNQINVIAVMLTAHAVSPQNVINSYKGNAASYVPKDKLDDIAGFLIDVLEAKKKGRDTWWRWLSRLSNFWREEFGPRWQHPDEEFWKKLKEL